MGCKSAPSRNVSYSECQLQNPSWLHHVLSFNQGGYGDESKILLLYAIFWRAPKCVHYHCRSLLIAHPHHSLLSLLTEVAPTLWQRFRGAAALRPRARGGLPGGGTWAEDSRKKHGFKQQESGIHRLKVALHHRNFEISIARNRTSTWIHLDEG